MSDQDTLLSSDLPSLEIKTSDLKPPSRNKSVDIKVKRTTSNLNISSIVISPSKKPRTEPLSYNAREIKDIRGYAIYFAGRRDATEALALLLEPEVVNSEKVAGAAQTLPLLQFTYRQYEARDLLLSIIWYFFHQLNLVRKDENFTSDFENFTFRDEAKRKSPAKKKGPPSDNDNKAELKEEEKEELRIGISALKDALAEYTRKNELAQAESAWAFIRDWIDQRLQIIIEKEKKSYLAYIQEKEISSAEEQKRQDDLKLKGEISSSAPSAQQQESLQLLGDNTKIFWNSFKLQVKTNIVHSIHKQRNIISKDKNASAKKIQRLIAKIQLSKTSDIKIKNVSVDLTPSLKQLPKSPTQNVGPHEILGQRISPTQQWRNEDEEEVIYAMADIPIKENIPNNLFVIVRQFFVNWQREQADAKERSQFKTKIAQRKRMIASSAFTTPRKPKNLSSSITEHLTQSQSPSEEKLLKSDLDEPPEETADQKSSASNKSKGRDRAEESKLILTKPKDLENKVSLQSHSNPPSDPDDDLDSGEMDEAKNKRAFSRRNSLYSDEIIDNGDLNNLISPEYRKEAIKMLVRLVIDLQNNLLKRILRHYTIKSYTEHLMNYMAATAHDFFSWNSAQLKQNIRDFQRVFFLMSGATNANKAQEIYQNEFFTNYANNDFKTNLKKRYAPLTHFFLCCFPSLKNFSCFQSQRQIIFEKLRIEHEGGLMRELRNIDHMELSRVREQLTNKIKTTHFIPDSKTFQLSNIIKWPSLNKPIGTNELTHIMEEAILSGRIAEFERTIDSMDNEKFNNLFLNNGVNESSPLKWIVDYKEQFENDYIPNVWERFQSLDKIFAQPESYLRFKQKKEKSSEINTRLENVARSKLTCLQSAFQSEKGVAFFDEVQAQLGQLTHNFNKGSIKKPRQCPWLFSDIRESTTSTILNETSSGFKPEDFDEERIWNASFRMGENK